MYPWSLMQLSDCLTDEMTNDWPGAPRNLHASARMGNLLSVAGAVIAVVSIVVGIWLQFETTIGEGAPAHFVAQARLSLVMDMLIPLALGLLLLAAGRVVATLEIRTSESNSATETLNG